MMCDGKLVEVLKKVCWLLEGDLWCNVVFFYWLLNYWIKWRFELD